MKRHFFQGWLWLLRTSIRHGLEIVQQCDKRVLTKSQVFKANSYIWRNYKGKTDTVWGLFALPQKWIG